MYKYVFIDVEDLTLEQSEILLNRINKDERPSEHAGEPVQYGVDLEYSTYFYTAYYLVNTERWVRAKTFEEFEQLVLEYQLTH